jgi:hypothetical protein
MSDVTEDIVYQRVARLLAVRDAVADAFGGQKRKVTDPKDLSEVVRRVREAIQAVPDAYGTIIGGLAVQELGYVRWTEDVDVVLDAAHYAEVLEHLRNHGFTLHDDLILRKTDTGTILDVLKEGQRLKDSQLPVPPPSELGPNRGFAKLEAVIRLKLDSGGRMKDLADIVELLKRYPDRIGTVQSSLPEILKPEYIRLAAQARREMQP